ncbi:MAG: GatB/YqeY domain-containing protein [Solirubrobacterales bacterium]|nr:GatB/YqeY domain-containing protein [Solirubrobacterales bacterium]
MPATDTLTTQIKADVTAALKGGDKQRVGALRLVLSELLKDAKEGPGDEVAVLRRERKRRIEAATQFRDGGRVELAIQEESEAALIESYLPAEITDDQIAQIVAKAIADTGAQSVKEMGSVMAAAMEAVAGRADGKRVSTAVKAGLSA